LGHERLFQRAKALPMELAFCAAGCGKSLLVPLAVRMVVRRVGACASTRRLWLRAGRELGTASRRTTGDPALGLRGGYTPSPGPRNTRIQYGRAASGLPWPGGRKLRCGEGSRRRYQELRSKQQDSNL